MKEIVDKIRVQLESSPEVFEENFKYDLRIAEEILADPFPLPIGDLDRDAVIRRLRESKLHKPQYRKFWIRVCNEIIDELLNESSEVDEDWFVHKKKLALSLGRTDLAAKIFWLQVIHNARKKDLWTKTELNSMEVLAPRFRARHLRDLFRFFEYKVKGIEILPQKTIEDLNDLVLFLKTLDYNRQPEELNAEDLLELVEDYRNSLKFCYDVVRNLQQSVNNDLRQLAELEVEEWFSNMNSSSSGYLLDSFYSLMMRNESNAESYKNFILLFRNFLQKSGIKPIYPAKQVSITEEDLKYVDLIGEPMGNKPKQVSVLSPGWKFKDRVISKARVVEVKDHE